MAGLEEDPVKQKARIRAKKPALWQIFFDENETSLPEEVLPEVSESPGGKYRSLVNPVWEEHQASIAATAASGSEEGAKAEPGVRMERNGEVDIVIFDKRHSEDSASTRGAKKWDSVDLTPGGDKTRVANVNNTVQEDEKTYMIRTESDLELAYSDRSQWCTRLCSRFSRCQRWPGWNSYYVVILTGAVMLLIYAAVILIILKVIGIYN